jgi:hypothetical protein
MAPVDTANRVVSPTLGSVSARRVLLSTNDTGGGSFLTFSDGRRPTLRDGNALTMQQPATLIGGTSTAAFASRQVVRASRVSILRAVDRTKTSSGVQVTPVHARSRLSAQSKGVT